MIEACSNLADNGKSFHFIQHKSRSSRSATYLFVCRVCLFCEWREDAEDKRGFTPQSGSLSKLHAELCILNVNALLCSLHWRMVTKLEKHFVDFIETFKEHQSPGSNRLLN